MFDCLSLSWRLRKEVNWAAISKDSASWVKGSSSEDSGFWVSPMKSFENWGICEGVLRKISSILVVIVCRVGGDFP